MYCDCDRLRRCIISHEYSLYVNDVRFLCACAVDLCSERTKDSHSEYLNPPFMGQVSMTITFSRILLLIATCEYLHFLMTLCFSATSEIRGPKVVTRG